MVSYLNEIYVCRIDGTYNKIPSDSGFWNKRIIDTKAVLKRNIAATFLFRNGVIVKYT